MASPSEFQSSQVKSSTAYIRKVRDFEDLYENSNVAGPTGLIYVPTLDRFFTFSGTSTATSTEGAAISPQEDQDLSRFLRLPTSLNNAINTVFDSRFNRLLIIQNNNQLFEVKTDENGVIDAQTLSSINLRRDLGLSKPEGITVDPNTGVVYVLNKSKNSTEIIQIVPDSSGRLENGTLTRIAIDNTIKNPRGIAFDPISGRFQVLSAPDQLLYEITATGEIAATRSIKGLGLRNPQALVFAPSGDQTDDPKRLSLYVADNTKGGSGIVELSFIAPQSNSNTTSLSLIQTVQTSQFSSPSPDPSGITYINQTNTVLISDGEVDEIPALYTGNNLFQSTLTGSLQQSFTSAAFSKEATGVGYNPANQYLYISDDNADRIFQLNPGIDGVYNTSDDFFLTLFSTRTFNSFDPEDVVFSPFSGNLFVVDGVNAEVYQVTAAGTLINHFDTESLGILDPEGITFLDNGDLVVVGKPANTVAEITTTGSLVQLFDISAANALKPAGLATGKSSSNANALSLYVVDRGIDNNENPNENDGKLFEFSLGTSIVNRAPVVEAGPDQTIALQAFLQGWVYDDGLSGSSVTTSWSLVSGPGNVIFTGSNNLATRANFSTPGSYVLSLNANDGLLSTTDQISVRVIDPQSALFVSMAGSGTVGGITYQDEDVLVLNQSTNTWSMYFDGTDLGLSSLNVRDFHINSDGTMLFAISSPATLIGLGEVEAHDIIRFIPTATGEITEGRFELYFDGSDVGLTTDGARLDGIAIAPDGRIIISTRGSVSVAGVSATDEDLLAFSPTSLGNATAGSWALYFDGSDVNLNDSSEDVSSLWIDSSTRLLLTTEGEFNVPGASGTGSDVFQFTPTLLGSTTSGSYSSFWTASSAGLTTAVDGITRIL